ncbi:MAG: VWA-like domain-containing protein [Nitrososphaeria archaeon]
MTDITKIKDDYEKIKSSLYITVPFIASLLSRVKIILSDMISTCGVNHHDIIAINPNFWNTLSLQDKAWVIAHEVLHVAFRDLQRTNDREHKKWNIVCDGVNNSLLTNFLKRTAVSEIGINLEDLYEYAYNKVRYDQFSKMSKEEIYSLISNNIPTTTIIIYDIFSAANSQNTDAKPTDANTITGIVIQEGDPNLYKASGEEKEEKWKEAIANAYALQKSIGKTTDSLNRLVNQILKPKINWKVMLRQAINVGYDKCSVTTWKKPNRKHNDLPGYIKYSIPDVWCLVDTSGSIDDKTLIEFISEIYAIAGKSKVRIIPWDTIAYDTIELKSKNDITKVKTMKGGGGTIIYPALKKTINNMKNNDIVVVFSDFEIYDLDEPETTNAFKEIASKASSAILCSKGQNVYIPKWRTISLN